MAYGYKHLDPRWNSSTRDIPTLPWGEGVQPREFPRCKSPQIPLGTPMLVAASFSPKSNRLYAPSPRKTDASLPALVNRHQFQAVHQELSDHLAGLGVMAGLV